MIDNIYVFDDIVDKEEQERIKNDMLGRSFPWYFMSDITNPAIMLQKRPGFSHYFVNDYEVNSNRGDLIEKIIDNSVNKINFKLNKIIKCRGFLQIPIKLDPTETLVDSPHIDIPEKHLVILYYVSDTDGDTIIYNETFKDGIELPDPKLMTEKQRVKPKQGRVVIFNGHTYHSGTQSVNDVRCVINTNLI